MTYFAPVPQFVPPPVPSSRRRRPRPPNSSSSTRICWRWCPSPSQWGSACSFLGRVITRPCLPTNNSTLSTSSSSNAGLSSRINQCLDVCQAHLKHLCRALGPDPDLATPPSSSSSSHPFSSSSSSTLSLQHCFSASTISPSVVKLRSENQLRVWEEQRRRQAWVLIARYWGGMVVLNLLFLLDSRFRSLVEGMLDSFYTSMVMAMVFYAVVALSDPGYLPLHFPVQEEEEKAGNEDKQIDGREAVGEEKEQERQQQQQGVLLEEGRGGGGGGQKEGEKEEGKEREPRARMASGAGDLDIIEEEGGGEEGREEEEEEEDEAELCAYLGEEASLTGSDEREEGEEEGGEDNLDSDSESLLLEVVEATSTTAGVAAAAAAAAAAGGEEGGVVREWLRRRYCAACRVHRMPLRTKHCKGCGRCVSRLDHHSPWVNNCIGAGNHLSFVLFLFFQSLHLSLALLLLLLLGLPSFLSHYNFDRGLFGLLGGLSQNLLFAAPQAIIEQPLPSLLFLLVAFLWCVSHAALFAQLKVVCNNLLTVEARGGGNKFPYLVGGQNPFDKGCFWNVISFLSLFYQYHQERRTKERRQKQRQAGREGFSSSSFSSSSWPSAAALALSSSLSSSSSSSTSSTSSYPSATLASPPHSASSSSSSSSSSPSSSSISSQSSPSSSPCDSPTAALLSSSSINSFSFRSLSSSALGAASSASSSASSSSFFTYFRRKFSSSSGGAPQQQQQQQRQQQHLPPPAFSFFRSKKSRPLPLPLKIAP